MKKISYAVLTILLGFLSFWPLVASAQAESNNHLQVFIQYQAKPGTCRTTVNDQVSTFGWAGFRLQSGITDYRVNFNTMPANLSREGAIAIFDFSYSVIQGAGGGILFHYAGESSETSVSNDNRNTLLWKRLPASMVAVTYIWTDNNNRVINADTVFNNLYRWTYTGYSGQNDCSAPRTSFDLRNIATHEFGHWVGLGDLYDTASRDLTMYGYASRGELKKDNLGLGDIIGIRAVWP